MDHYEIVMKLIGPVRPVGETHTDNKRADNLAVLLGLIDKLLDDVHDIESYKRDYRASVKHAGETCAEFLDALGIKE